MGNTKACLCADANRKGLKMGSEAVKYKREGGREGEPEPRRGADPRQSHQ